MSTKENKELVRQFDKSRNEVAGDTAKVRPLYEKYCAPGYIFHLVSQGDKNWSKQYSILLWPRLHFQILIFPLMIW